MGQLSIWSYPTRVLFGVGAVDETGNEVKRLGASRALIVTDMGVVGAGLVAPVEQALASAGISMTLFTGVDPNPVEKNVHEGVTAYREAKADIIVAVGGGSPLDVGKIIRLKARPEVDSQNVTEPERGILLHYPPDAAFLVVCNVLGLWCVLRLADSRE